MLNKIFGKSKQNQITIEQIDEIVRMHNKDIAEALKESNLRFKTLEERCHKLEQKPKENPLDENTINWINYIPVLQQEIQTLKAEISELRSVVSEKETEIKDLNKTITFKVGWLKKYAPDLEEARLKLQENGAKLPKLKS